MATKPKAKSTTPQEIADTIFSLMQEDPTGDKARKWVEANQASWSSTQLEQAYTSTWEKASAAGGVMLFDPSLAFPKGSAVVGRVKDQRGVADLTDKAAGVLDSGGTNFDLNNDGQVDQYEQQAQDNAIKNKSKAVADATNEDPAKVEAGIRGQFELTNWNASGVLQYTGGSAPTQQQVNEMMAAYNEMHPAAPVSDSKGLAEALGRTATADQKGILETVFLGKEPSRAYTVTLAGQNADGTPRTFTVEADKFDVMAQTWGYSSRDLTNLLRSADRVGVKTADSSLPAWQIIGALARAQRQVTLENGQTVSLLNPQDKQFASTTVGKLQAQETRGQGGVNAPMHSSLDRLGLKFNEGMYIYGQNATLAYLHALNPSLAAKAAGDPKKLTDQDRLAIGQRMLDGGFDQTALANMGYFALGIDDYANSHYGSGANGGGATRMTPDMDAIRQSVKDMYQQMYASTPDAQELEGMVKSVASAIASAPQTQSVDGGAQIRKVVSLSPKYKELYGQLPEGVSEEEYQGQFRSAAQTLLGNETPDADTIRSGMRTGDMQTTLGQIQSSGKAWENSTFMGRLAAAAQIISQGT